MTATIFSARRLDMDSKGLSSIARWFAPDGAPLCWALEPGPQRQPHPRIPAGLYPLCLRTIGEKHEQYLKHYGPVFHKGMVEICDVPDRIAIEAHKGNSIHDTLGCSLWGTTALKPEISNSLLWEVTASAAAYERVYPVIRDAILDGPTLLRIFNMGEGA